MIHNEDAYYTGYARNVREFGGGSKGSYIALVFDTIAGLIRETGTGEVANSTILDMYGGSAPTLRDAISVLISKGYLDRKSGDGRGNKSVYIITKKGKENCPFMQEKGERIFPERGKNFSIKGKKSFTINKELNKELKEREVTPTPISNPNEKIVMKDFETWWSKYPGDPDYSYDKENCEKVWSLMQPEWREKLVTMAERGIRWRTKQNDKPIFYLRDYAGQDAQMELPFVRQGSKTFAKWIDEHEHKDVICLFRYEGSLAYCLEDAKQMMIDAGAEFIRSWI